MTDITERLRQLGPVGQEAAAEIERLRLTLRVNVLRLAPYTSHEEIDKILYPSRVVLPPASRD